MSIITDGDSTVEASGGGSSASDIVLTDAYGSIPAAGIAGRLFLPTDSHYIFRDNGASWVPFLNGKQVTLPVDGDYSWDNQGGASVSASSGAIALTVPAVAGDNLRVRYKTAPSVPYVITAAFLVDTRLIDFCQFGLCFRQNSTGELATMSITSVSAAGDGFGYANYKYTNSTSFSTAYVSAARNTRLFQVTPMWLRIEDDNTDRKSYISVDGLTFREVHSVGRTDFLTADQVGFFGNSENTTAGMTVNLLSWHGS